MTYDHAPHSDQTPIEPESRNYGDEPQDLGDDAYASVSNAKLLKFLGDQLARKNSQGVGDSAPADDDQAQGLPHAS